MSLLLWPSSAARGRKALRKSYGSFHGPGEQQGLFPGSPECPKKAARVVWFLLRDVAAGEGGAWLPGGTRQPWYLRGAAWACCSSCLVRSVGVRKARLCCASSNYAESFKVIDISILNEFGKTSGRLCPLKSG